MKGLTSDRRMLEYGQMKSYSNISCFSTTRYGGQSEGNYASFNCTHYCGDREEHVALNRELLCSLLSQRPLALVIPRQTHSTNVKVIASPEDMEDLEEVDALVTSLPRFCLCVSTADCIPVLLYDKVRKVVAAIHAGWRGTVGCIVRKTLEVMHDTYGTEGEDVVACIGPGISLASFEVGDEVYQAFEQAGFDMPLISKRFDKWHIDLWEANRLQLLAFGVKETQIEVAGICTYQSFGTFYSARRMGIRSGRILSGIMLHK